MNPRSTRLVSAVVAVAREKQLTLTAAGLAYYAFNALLALAVLSYALFSEIGTESVLARTLALLSGVGATAFERLFEQLGGNTAGRRRASLLALVISVWSSLRLFSTVDQVFSEVYEARKERSLVGRYVDSVLVMGAVTVSLVILVSVGTLFVFRTADWLWPALGPAILWLSFLFLLVPTYAVFTVEVASLRDLLPGAVVTAIGWTVSAVVFRLYLSFSESVELFGVVGAVLLTLSWLYVGGLSLLLGVVLNALVGDHIEADEEWSLN